MVAITVNLGVPTCSPTWNIWLWVSWVTPKWVALVHGTKDSGGALGHLFFWRGPSKRWFSCWFPFKTMQKGRCPHSKKRDSNNLNKKTQKGECPLKPFETTQTKRNTPIEGHPHPRPRLHATIRSKVTSPVGRSVRNRRPWGQKRRVPRWPKETPLLLSQKFREVPFRGLLFGWIRLELFGFFQGYTHKKLSFSQRGQQQPRKKAGF